MNKKSPIRNAFLCYGIAVVVYLAGTILFATAYPSVRLVEPVKSGPNTRVASESYHGQLAVFGWPLAYFAMREEALDTENNRPMQIVATRFSLISLLLNVAGVCAVLPLVRSAFRANGFRQFTLRGVFLCVLCLCVLLGIAASTRYPLLEPIPVYPDETER